MEATIGPTSGTDQHPYHLRFVSWELSRRCNARCLHCFTSSGPEVSQDGELGTDDALLLIDQLAAEGPTVLSLSGGEPLLRPDWRALVEHAVGRGLIVTIVTNGSPLTDAVADDLVKLGVASVAVSLDSHQAERHDEIRQLPGLFVKAVQGIRRLVRRGVRVIVSFTATRLNQDDLWGVVELTHELGAAAVALAEYVPMGRGGKELELSPAELSRLLEQWQAIEHSFAGKLQLFPADHSAALLGREGNDEDCGAGRNMVHVGPDGKVTACAFLEQPLAFLKTEKLSCAWARAPYLLDARRRLGETASRCAECGLRLASS